MGHFVRRRPPSFGVFTKALVVWSYKFWPVSTQDTEETTKGTQRDTKSMKTIQMIVKQTWLINLQHQWISQG